MMTPQEIAIREAWSAVPAPPLEDLIYMEWGWGPDAYRTFAGVAPMDVDTHSLGFYAATPLMNLPPRAAAAYLGPYLISIVQSVERQRVIGLFSDILARAHVMTCLSSE